MTGDVMSIALYVLFVAGAAAIPLFVLRESARQTRGTFGRPYGNVVTDTMQESTRRSDLLLRLVEAREARIARLERRLEGGR
jgi:hypothetical protein